MGRPRPTPRTDADMYADATLEVLDEIRDLMRDVRDRLPDRPEPASDGTVELREPAQTGSPEASEVKLAEPKSDTAEDETGPASAGPARPRRKPRKGGST